MAQYSNLKAYIEEKIYENGTQAITGDILQDVLKVMTDDLGEFYQTGGVASPSTDPGTPDAKVIYFATEAGTYTNFGGITLAAGEVALLIFETSWTKVELNVLSSANGGVKTANLADGAVTTEKIAGGAVETAKIANNAVTSGKVADGAIGTAKIADGAIAADKIAANAVESAKIKNGAVTEGKINDGAVTADKVAANAVTTAKIADDAVTTAKLNDGAVTEDKIATDAVTSGKVKDGAIGTAKIAAGAVTHAKIGAGAVEESNIKDGAVTSDKIANGAVGSDQLAEGAFSAENLADGSVTTDKLADGAVTAEKIADGAVTADKFANGSVTTIKLGSGAVTTEKIGDGMVTRQKLADSSVGTSKIIDGAVTTDKVADGAITDAKLENPVSVSQNTQTGGYDLVIGNNTNESAIGNNEVFRTDELDKVVFGEIARNITGLLNINGTLDTSYTNAKTSDFIPVVEGQKLQFTGSIGNNLYRAGVCGYSSNTQASFVSVLSPSENKIQGAIITIPSGVNYIRVSALTSSASLYIPVCIILYPSSVATIGERFATNDKQIDFLKDNTKPLQLNEISTNLDGAVQVSLTSYGGTVYWTTAGDLKAGIYLLTGISDGTVNVKVATAVAGTSVYRELLVAKNNSVFSFILSPEDIQKGGRYLRIEKTSDNSPVLYYKKLLYEQIEDIKNYDKVQDAYANNVKDATGIIYNGLNKNTELATSPDLGFANFSGGVATKTDDYISVDTSNPGSGNYFPGIRNNAIGALMKTSLSFIIISFKAKIINGGTSFKLALYYKPSIAATTIELTEDWQEYSYVIPKSELNNIDRLQFSRSSSDNTGLGFEIKDLKVYSEGLELDVRELCQKTASLRGKKIAIIGDSISTISGNNNPYWIVKSIDVGQEIQSYVTWWDVWTNDAGTNPTNKTIGGVTLTSTMIGTLQTFTPVAEDVGKSIGVPANYNSSTTKVWSQWLCERTGMTLLANASWSGARMCSGQTGTWVLSEAWSDYTIGCCKTRDGEGNEITPDIIIIYRGTNDFSHGPVSQINDVSLMNGIPDSDYVQTWPEFRIAYYKTIQKLRVAYPKAYIICCTLNVFKRMTYDVFPTRNSYYTLPQMNNAIREIANMMGCGLIEFDKDGITFENCYAEGYITDSATMPTHPNSKGHTVMAERALSDLRYILQH